MNTFETKPYRLSRKMVIAEAAFEYLINILVTGSFLARLTTSLGFSDSLTGVLSAIASLGCIFQLTSLLIRPKRVKTVVLGCTIVSELLFLALYLVPVIPFSQQGKTTLFVVFLTLAYLAMMVISSKKMNWFMSLVGDGHRGSFTASKEMISLAAGIAYSYIMGRVIDSCQADGNMNRAFGICAVLILILLILQLLCQIFTFEQERPPVGIGIYLSDFKSALGDRTILRLTLFLILYRVGTFTATAFYGTYQIKELGFSQTLVVILVAIGSVVRMVCSPFMGRYADRHSFAKMERICLVFQMMSFIAAALAAPENGMVFFTLYYVLNAIAMAGANSAVTNLVFDCVPKEKCADALAISQAASGAAGFLATLAASRLVGEIQERGNSFLGTSIYAQQLTSLIAAAIMGLCIVYISKEFIRKRGSKNE